MYQSYKNQSINWIYGWSGWFSYDGNISRNWILENERHQNFRRLVKRTTSKIPLASLKNAFKNIWKYLNSSFIFRTVI